MTSSTKTFNTKSVKISDLKPHPRNYRQHPEDQIQHLVQSITEHGLYRNIIAARDMTILAGHGVVEACKKIGLTEVPIFLVDVESESPAALKILTGDNEISHLGEINDRTLTELLKDIKSLDVNGLLGTGYDERMLASLVMVTRPTSEIANINEAADWVGMPEYDEGCDVFKVSISFESKEKRDEFFEMLKAKHINGRDSKCASMRWPDTPEDDPSSVMFEA